MLVEKDGSSILRFPILENRLLADFFEPSRTLSAKVLLKDNVVSKPVSSEVEPSVVFKIVLLGDAMVGKTSFARRIIKKRFRPRYHKTIGVDISHINYTMPDGTKAVITLWDLSGDEQFSSLRSVFFTGTTGVLMVIDVTKDLNYDSLSSWFTDIDKNMASKINIALIANKVDLKEHRVVGQEFIEGTAMILEDQVTARKVKAFETSAKTGYGCKEAMDWLIGECIRQVDQTNILRRRVFDPANVPSVLFKMTEIGPNAEYRDFDTLSGVEDVESYLLNLGVALSTAIGQGHTYNEGIYSLPGGNLNGTQLFVYSFRLPDHQAVDRRLSIGLFIYVLLIPVEYCPYFEPFSKVEGYIAPRFKELGDASNLTPEALARIKLELLEEFEDLSTLD